MNQVLTDATTIGQAVWDLGELGWDVCMTLDTQKVADLDDFPTQEFSVDIWPFALDYAVYVYIHLP